MKRSLFVVVVAWSAIAQAQTDTAYPVIEVIPGALVDTVPPSALSGEQHYALQLWNTGNALLVVEYIRSSDPCFCSWPKDPIPPGKHIEVTVHCPPMHSGMRKQTYSIESNAPKPYTFTVTRIAGKE